MTDLLERSTSSKSSIRALSTKTDKPLKSTEKQPLTGTQPVVLVDDYISQGYGPKQAEGYF